MVYGPTIAPASDSPCVFATFCGPGCAQAPVVSGHNIHHSHTFQPCERKSRAVSLQPCTRLAPVTGRSAPSFKISHTSPGHHRTAAPPGDNTVAAALFSAPAHMSQLRPAHCAAFTQLTQRCRCPLASSDLPAPPSVLTVAAGPSYSGDLTAVTVAQPMNASSPF